VHGHIGQLEDFLRSIQIFAELFQFKRWTTSTENSQLAWRWEKTHHRIVLLLVH